MQICLDSFYVVSNFIPSVTTHLEMTYCVKVVHSFVYSKIILHMYLLDLGTENILSIQRLKNTMSCSRNEYCGEKKQVRKQM